MRKRITLLVAALMLALTMAFGAGAAFGKITPPSCTNPAGHEPPGQQPVCQGAALSQNPALNPAGHAPPGQQTKFGL